MKNPSQMRPTDPGISTSDVRQGSPKRLNLRVLAVSLALAVAVGLVMVGSFWFVTPNNVEGVPERSGVSQGETITPNATTPTPSVPTDGVPADGGPRDAAPTAPASPPPTTP